MEPPVRIGLMISTVSVPRVTVVTNVKLRSMSVLTIHVKMEEDVSHYLLGSNVIVNLDLQVIVIVDGFCSLHFA